MKIQEIISRIEAYHSPIPDYEKDSRACDGVKYGDPTGECTGIASAIESGRLGGYAAAAFAVEPLPADRPLRGAPRTLFTPHVAWATDGALRRLMEITTRNLSTFLAGKGENIVN